MVTRSTDAIALAPRANLEQFKAHAHELLKVCRSGDVGQLRTWATASLERIGRQAHLSATPAYVVKGSRRLDSDCIASEVKEIVREARESRLLASSTGKRAVPLARALLFLGRLHGFESWPKFAQHLAGCGDRRSAVWQFEAAADAIVTGNLAALRRLIHKNPSLVRARSTRGHRATLLHYTGANGHEGFRQLSPRNAAQIARFLLGAGAAVDALADMYGHRVTTMEMLVSSVHPHLAGVQVTLVNTLLDFGAAPNGVEDNESPLMTAFRFHYPKAAEALARRGARVDNVISAAALGRADLVDRFVGARGMLRGGAPPTTCPWPKFSRDPKDHLGYALTWACTFGRTEVVKLLLRKAVDASGHDDDASALHFAAAFGRLHLVRLLLKHGASLETPNSYGGTVLDGTVWYALNSPIRGVDYVAVVRALLRAGARVDAYPEMKTYVDAVLAGQRGGGYVSVANLLP